MKWQVECAKVLIQRNWALNFEAVRFHTCCRHPHLRRLSLIPSPNSYGLPGSGGCEYRLPRMWVPVHFTRKLVGINLKTG